MNAFVTRLEAHLAKLLTPSSGSTDQGILRTLDFSRQPATHLPQMCVAMTLVEVVIALGIVAFALIPVIGFLSISMKSSDDSRRDTAIAMASRQMIGQLRAQTNFMNAAPQVVTLFFSQDGGLQKEANANSAMSAVLVQVPRADNPNFVDVTITFRWPSGSTNPQNEKTIQASIANF